MVYSFHLNDQNESDNLNNQNELDNFNNQNELDTLCTICYTINSNKYLTCNHCFHENCINNWININIFCPTCPICRANI